jgi:hypothetical protein
MVEQATGGADDNVRALPKRTLLLLHVLPAHDQRCTDAPPPPKLVNDLLDLHGQLSRRRQDQRSRPAPIGQALDDRNHECGSLACPGLCAPDYILTGKRVGDRHSLDWCGRGITGLADPGEHICGQTKTLKRRNG